MQYGKPTITDHGDVRQITAGHIARQYDDSVHLTGGIAIQGTSGPCLSFMGVTLPCTALPKI
jgi:hypothetical protein